MRRVEMKRRLTVRLGRWVYSQNSRVSRLNCDQKVRVGAYPLLSIYRSSRRSWKGISGGLRGLERGDPGCQSGSQLIREYGTLEPGNSSWMDQLQQWLEGPSAFYELHYFGEVGRLQLVGLFLPIGSRWVSPVTAEITLLIPSILVPEI